MHVLLALQMTGRFPTLAHTRGPLKDLHEHNFGILLLLTICYDNRANTQILSQRIQAHAL